THVEQVDELVALLAELDDVVAVDGGDVRGAGAGDELLLQALVLGVELTLVQGDGDAGVLLLVLGDEVAQPEVAPEGDGELDLFGGDVLVVTGVGGGGLLVSAGAAGGEKEGGCCTDREKTRRT